MTDLANSWLETLNECEWPPKDRTKLQNYLYLKNKICCVRYSSNFKVNYEFLSAPYVKLECDGAWEEQRENKGFKKLI